MLRRSTFGSLLLSLAACLFAGCGRAAPALHDGPIVLVTFDALRADACSPLGGPPGGSPGGPPVRMPRLEALAREATWAGHGIAPSTESVAALGTLLTGLRPWQHQALHAERPQLAPDLLTLAEALHRRGYTTAGYPADPWGQPWFGAEQGFDAFARLGRGRRALERLSSLGAGRHFVWVHLPQRLGAGRADERLGELLDALGSGGHRDRALIVVTALHGAASEGGTLERAGLEVPLLVKLPQGSSLHLRPPVTQRVAVARIWATLVEAVGGEVPPAVAPSLWRSAPPEALSELYRVHGSHRFSLLVSDPAGDLQLLQEVRFAPAPPDEVPPFRGLGGPAGRSRTLERWLPGGGTVQVDDPQRLAELALRLDRFRRTVSRRRAGRLARTPAAARSIAQKQRRSFGPGGVIY